MANIIKNLDWFDGDPNSLALFAVAIPCACPVTSKRGDALPDDIAKAFGMEGE